MKTNDELFAELDAFIESKNNDSTELIAILHRAQSIFGYLPMIVQTHIARKLNISVSKVYGVVTFYSFFTMVPKGEYVINFTCFKLQFFNKMLIFSFDTSVTYKHTEV